MARTVKVGDAVELVERPGLDPVPATVLGVHEGVDGQIVDLLVECSVRGLSWTERSVGLEGSRYAASPAKCWRFGAVPDGQAIPADKPAKPRAAKRSRKRKTPASK